MSGQYRSPNIMDKPHAVCFENKWESLDHEWINNTIFGNTSLTSTTHDHLLIWACTQMAYTSSGIIRSLWPRVCNSFICKCDKMKQRSVTDFVTLKFMWQFSDWMGVWNPLICMQMWQIIMCQLKHFKKWLINCVISTSRFTYQWYRNDNTLT